MAAVTLPWCVYPGSEVYGSTDFLALQQCLHRWWIGWKTRHLCCFPVYIKNVFYTSVAHYFRTVGVGVLFARMSFLLLWIWGVEILFWYINMLVFTRQEGILTFCSTQFTFRFLSWISKTLFLFWGSLKSWTNCCSSFIWTTGRRSELSWVNWPRTFPVTTASNGA